MATAEMRPIGGQAVVEGVMMRGAERWAVAVRRPDGTIGLLVGDVPAWSGRWERMPFARGIAALAESLSLGIRALGWSAGESGDVKAKASGAAGPMWPTVALALVLVVSFFFLLPALAASALGGTSTVAFHAIEAGLRLGLFLAYLVGIGRLAQVRRVFEYHGAEHKAVAAHESGGPLTPEAASRFSTIHPRCGTSFLLVVMVIAIVAHAAFGRPGIADLIASRLLVVPVAAAAAYEVLRLSARHRARRGVRFLMAPVLGLQRLTTREPGLDQLEVAIAALDAVVMAEQPAPVQAPVAVDVATALTPA